MFPRVGMSLLVLGACLTAARAAEQPLAEKYLLEGKLADGEKALQARLEKEAGDDQARFCLGVIQFFRSFERLGAGLNKYGLRTERAFGGLPHPLREIVPQNPHPEKLTYAASREIVRAWLEDLNKAAATLAGGLCSFLPA